MEGSGTSVPPLLAALQEAMAACSQKLLQDSSWSDLVAASSVLFRLRQAERHCEELYRGRIVSPADYELLDALHAWIKHDDSTPAAKFIENLLPS